jgi:hypothetical protein
MNEHDLERELAALRPLGVSPRLQQQIARDLATATAGRRYVGTQAFWRRTAVLAAALLLAAWFWSIDSGKRPLSAAYSVTDSPTLRSYRRAFLESPETFDALLDAQAARGGLLSAAPTKAGDAFGALVPL